MTKEEILNFNMDENPSNADVRAGLAFYDSDAESDARYIKEYGRFLNGVVVHTGHRYYHEFHEISQKYIMLLEAKANPDKEMLAFLYLKDAEYFNNYSAFAETLRQASKAIELGDSVPAYLLSSAYNIALGALWNCGLYKESEKYMKLMEELLENELLPSDFSFTNLCNLMNGYAILGDAEKSDYYYKILSKYTEADVGPNYYCFIKLFKLSDEARLNEGKEPSEEYIEELRKQIEGIKPGNGVEEDYGSLFIPVIKYVKGYMDNSELIDLCINLIETTISLPDKINLYKFMFSQFGMRRDTHPHLYVRFYAALERYYDMTDDTRKHEASAEILNQELAEKYKLSAGTDELTHIGNRYAYDNLMAEISKQSVFPEDLHIFMMDLNGLKGVNDNFGHSAGDEYIIGASECIKDAFGSADAVYRVGGDEFVAVVNTAEKNVKSILAKLDKKTEAWQGSYSKKLTISIGYSASEDVKEFSDESVKERVDRMLKIADRRMYEAKKAFYERTGENRRT